jgi:hypothetical protein
MQVKPLLDFIADHESESAAARPHRRPLGIGDSK